jgi:hypothetical protein
MPVGVGHELVINQPEMGYQIPAPQASSRFSKTSIPAFHRKADRCRGLIADHE